MNQKTLLALYALSLLFIYGCDNKITSIEELGQIDERIVVHKDLERSFLIYIPHNLKENPALIVAIHGYTSSAKTLMDYSSINDIADREGFLVVYPQGTKDSRNNNFFNVGYEFHSDSNIDDVSFIRKIVTDLKEEYKLDSKRIFATGMSNGIVLLNPKFSAVSIKLSGPMYSAPISANAVLQETRKFSFKDPPQELPP